MEPFTRFRSFASFRATASAVVVAVALTALASCGGGGSSSSSNDDDDDDVTFALTVGVIGNGSVASSPAGITCGVDCNENFTDGTVVTLTANEGSEADFTGWSGDCSGSNMTCQVTMSAIRNVTATFTGTGSGDFTRVSISGFGYVNTADNTMSCGNVAAAAAAGVVSTKCVTRYSSGSKTFTATPYNASFRFDHWTGSCASNSGNSCTLDVSTGKKFGAVFVPVSSGTDICQAMGLISDKTVRTLAGHFPALGIGESFTDPKFGTTIRRVTNVKNDGRGSHNVFKTVYSTISAWNADESYFFLYRTDGGPARHELFNGKTFQYIRALDDLRPVDLEQVYWDTNDPDILYYANRVDDTFNRYHVSSGEVDVIRNFSVTCGSNELHGGGDPMFSSWDSSKFGLACAPNGIVFGYDPSTNTMGATTDPNLSYNAPQAAPSGTLFFLNQNSGGSSASATVRDFNMNILRTLDLDSGNEHGGLSLLSNGHDTWNAVAFDNGPAGSPTGTLVQHDMTTGASRLIVGPGNGYPYPPSGTHVGPTAFHRTGLLAVSVKDDMEGDSLLDDEMLFVDSDLTTNPASSVCRVGHHRTTSDNYWAEPHPSLSPSGTRIMFSSSWGDSNGSAPVVNVYVIELPGYRQ